MGWVTAHHPAQEALDACVQCGLCLPTCPTFRMTGRETASPRGRLHAMMAVADGEAAVDEVFAGVLDFCLGCRACEPVCPGLVPYGKVLEGARAEIDAQVEGRGQRRWLLGRALGQRSLMRLGGLAASVGQRLGLTRLLPVRYHRLVSGMRPLAGRGAGVVGYASSDGDAGLVGLLAGCIQDEWFRPVNRIAIDLLESAGYEVVSPKTQTCCGALAAHDGKVEEAHRLEQRNYDTFGGCDFVVATAAGCSAHMQDYEWMPEVNDITVAIARAISDGRLPTSNANGRKIAIQDPCHLRHAQRVTTEPRLILEAAGYEVIESDPSGFCCGAAGMYTVLQPENSEYLGRQKADQVRSTGTTLVASANPGCEMQLRAFLGDDYEIRHPIEWYYDALRTTAVE